MPLAAPLGSPVSHSPSAALIDLATAQMLGLPASGNAAAGIGASLAGAPIGGAAGLALGGGGDGIVITGSPDVLVNSRPAGRVTDRVSCHLGATVMLGSDTVFINRQPAARVGDPATDGAIIIGGSPNVIIGGGSTGMPEVPPPCLQAAAMAGSAFIRP